MQYLIPLPNYLERFRFSEELRKQQHNLQQFFFSADLETLASNPGMPVKCLTSNLLQSRKRLATSSASSQSHTFVSSVESECHSSPKWDKDCQVRGKCLLPQSNQVCPVNAGNTIIFQIYSIGNCSMNDCQSIIQSSSFASTFCQICLKWFTSYSVVNLFLLGI